MRVESSVTTVSWIPSEAVTGPVLKGTFESGFTSYDEPPPDAIDDLEAWRDAGRFRFANRLSAWVEIEDGRIVDAGYAGGGMMGSTTVRLAKLRATFEPVELPDLQQEPERRDTEVRFVQTTGGRTGLPAPRRVKHPPFLQFRAPTVWTTLALTIARRRHLRLRGARREQVPPSLGVRRRGQGRGQGRAGELQGLVPRRVRQAHAVGCARVAGARHRGRDRARAADVGHDHVGR